LAFEQLTVKHLSVDIYSVYADWSFGNFWQP